MSKRFTRFILCTISVSVASSVQVTFADWSSFRNGGGSPNAGGPSGRRGAGGPGGPGGGMMAMLTAADKNGDGVLSADEIPVDFKPMLARLDTNSDGSLDATEIKAMAESVSARRANSQSDARDPIVYGAVASDGKILIRTGTRLFCLE